VSERLAVESLEGNPHQHNAKHGQREAGGRIDERQKLIE